MAGIFSEKLKTRVPVLKQKQKLGLTEAGARSFYYVIAENQMQLFDEEIPYLKPVREFMESLDGSSGKRFFLTAETEMDAIKVAVSMLRAFFYEKQSGYIEQMEDGDDDLKAAVEERCGQLRLVDLSEHLSDLPNGGNPYVGMAFGITPDTNVLFLGLAEDDKLQLRLDIIKGCDVGTQFVMLSPDQIEKPWARELMMDRECEILHIPKTDDGYYVQVVEELLDGERYRLDEKLQPERLVRILMKRRGRNRFCEEDIAWSLDYAVKQARTGKKRFILEERDFSFTGKTETAPMDRLNEMTGLGNAKQMAKEFSAFAQEQMRNRMLKKVCSHMIFDGNPGTGKTECAKIVAEIMAELGQSSGVFVEASRKDIVAGYVGQTAPKVAALFQRAQGGVLFVDEAGFFLHDTRGSFNQEAVKEFVRYMEMYQDVTVIFALYPHEVREWLDMEPGLASRISRIVRFEDYTIEELLEIAHYMCRQRGYRTEESADGVIADYIDKRKASDPKKFGNAREVRKLVESAIFARSLRRYEDRQAETVFVLREEDFKNGAARLIREEQELTGKKTIGFLTGVTAYGQS